MTQSEIYFRTLNKQRRILGYNIDDMDSFDSYIEQLITRDNIINELYELIFKATDRIEVLEEKLNKKNGV
jgi:hypothetical protein